VGTTGGDVATSTLAKFVGSDMCSDKASSRLSTAVSTLVAKSMAAVSKQRSAARPQQAKLTALP
jgi:hypothetical protein